jgi:hypothetical protein
MAARYHDDRRVKARVDRALDELFAWVLKAGRRDHRRARHRPRQKNPGGPSPSTAWGAMCTGRSSPPSTPKGILNPGKFIRVNDTVSDRESRDRVSSPATLCHRSIAFRGGSNPDPSSSPVPPARRKKSDFKTCTAKPSLTRLLGVRPTGIAFPGDGERREGIRMCAWLQRQAVPPTLNEPMNPAPNPNVLLDRRDPEHVTPRW